MSLSKGFHELIEVIAEIERIKKELGPWIDDMPPQCDLAEAINSIGNAVDGINEIQKKIEEQKQDD
jgi:hypothetical protein